MQSSSPPQNQQQQQCTPTEAKNSSTDNRDGGDTKEQDQLKQHRQQEQSHQTMIALSSSQSPSSSSSPTLLDSHASIVKHVIRNLKYVNHAPAAASQKNKDKKPLTATVSSTTPIISVTPNSNTSNNNNNSMNNNVVEHQDHTTRNQNNQQNTTNRISQSEISNDIKEIEKRTGSHKHDVPPSTRTASAPTATTSSSPPPSIASRSLFGHFQPTQRTSIADFELLKQIGKGNFGEVYLCHWNRDLHVSRRINQIQQLEGGTTSAWKRYARKPSLRKSSTSSSPFSKNRQQQQRQQRGASSSKFLPSTSSAARTSDMTFDLRQKEQDQHLKRLQQEHQHEQQQERDQPNRGGLLLSGTASLLSSPNYNPTHQFIKLSKRGPTTTSENPGDSKMKSLDCATTASGDFNSVENDHRSLRRSTDQTNSKALDSSESQNQQQQQQQAVDDQRGHMPLVLTQNSRTLTSDDFNRGNSDDESKNNTTNYINSNKQNLSASNNSNNNGNNDNHDDETDRIIQPGGGVFSLAVTSPEIVIHGKSYPRETIFICKVEKIPEDIQEETKFVQRAQHAAGVHPSSDVRQKLVDESEAVESEVVRQRDRRKKSKMYRLSNKLMMISSNNNDSAPQNEGRNNIQAHTHSASASPTAITSQMNSPQSIKSSIAYFSADQHHQQQQRQSLAFGASHRSSSGDHHQTQFNNNNNNNHRQHHHINFFARGSARNNDHDNGVVGSQLHSINNDKNNNNNEDEDDDDDYNNEHDITDLRTSSRASSAAERVLLGLSREDRVWLQEDNKRKDDAELRFHQSSKAKVKLMTMTSPSTATAEVQYSSTIEERQKYPNQHHHHHQQTPTGVDFHPQHDTNSNFYPSVASNTDVVVDDDDDEDDENHPGVMIEEVHYISRPPSSASPAPPPTSLEQHQLQLQQRYHLSSSKTPHHHQDQQRSTLAGASGLARAINMKQEAFLLSNCAHPNLVGFIDYFQKRDKQYLVLEYIDGCDLEKELLYKRSKNTFLSESSVAFVAVQIALGLEYLHRHNILHRDLKAANVLLSKKWLVKLADFGTAAAFDRDVDAPVNHSSAGTPLYLAPEIYKGRAASERADMYSLGVICYFTLELDFPYFATTTQELRQKVLYGVPRSFKRQNVSLPMLEAVQSLLQRDPARRPTALEFLQTPVMRKALDRYIKTLEQKANVTPLDRVWQKVVVEHAAIIDECMERNMSSQKSRRSSSASRSETTRSASSKGKPK